MHDEAFIFVRDSLAQFPPRRRVLEIGSYAVNGTVRELFPRCDYTGLDIRPGPNVDVVCDAAEYLAEPFDCVVTCETLEHATDQAGVIAAGYRLLDVNGALILTTAGILREPHSRDGESLPAGEFYRNVSVNDLLEWLKSFRDVRISEGRQGRDIYATAVR